MAKKPTKKQLAARQAAGERLAAISRAKSEARKAAQAVSVEDEVIPQSPATAATLEDDIPHAAPQPRVMPVPEGVVIPKKEPAVSPEKPDPTPVPLENSNLLDVIIRMQRQIDELASANANLTGKEKVTAMAEMQGAHVGNQGVQGRIYLYPIEQSSYPDLRDRLYDDPKLKRFALRENFYIKWEITGTTYEKYGVTYTEPQFMVEIWRYIFDEETGEPTGQMFLVNRHLQHEDEFIARVSADKLGLQLGEGKDFETLEDLMNEMRYYRIRRWLLEVFTPFKAHTHKNKKVRQQVIAGRVVEVTDTEVLTDKSSGIESAGALERETEYTPAERKELESAGLL